MFHRTSYSHHWSFSLSQFWLKSLFSFSWLWFQLKVHSVLWNTLKPSSLSLSVMTTVTTQSSQWWQQSPFNFLHYDYIQNHFPLCCDYSYHSCVSLSAISSTEGTHLLSWFREGSENVLTLVIFLGTKLHEEGDHYEETSISGLWASTLTITYTNSRSTFYWSEHGV